jgi:hypothetical protein
VDIYLKVLLCDLACLGTLYLQKKEQ